MKVKELIEQLSKFDPELEVLGEFDSDGDEFMVKSGLKEVYKGDNCDDSNWECDEKEYCIIQLNY